MWYLKYMYTDQKTGNAVKRSALLETGVYYTIGRSEDSTFVINSPKVANTHLILYIDPKDYPHVSPHLKLQVGGPSTLINGEPIDSTNLTQSQTLEKNFADYYKTVDVRIGKLGIKIKISNRLVLIKPGKDSNLQVDQLKNMGIVYDKVISDKTTYVISEPFNYSNHVLDALVRQIPIVPEAYIQEIINRKHSLIQNFEQNYPKVDDYLFDPLFKSIPSRKTIFDGILFIFAEKKQYEALKEILENAGAVTVLYDFLPDSSVEKLVHFISEKVSKQEKYLLVKLQSSQNENFLTSVYNTDGQEYQNLKLLNEAAKLLGIYLTSNEDIFNAVKDISIHNLFRKRVEKSNSSLPLPLTEQPAQKKSRRARFKQLDSLDFFAGGGKTESDDLRKIEPSAFEPVSNDQNNSQTLDLESHEDIQEPPKKKQRSRFKAIPNMMISLDHSSTEQEINSQPGQIDESNLVTGISQNEETLENEEMSTRHNETLIIPQSEGPIAQLKGLNPTKKTVRHQEAQSFTSALIDTKKLTDNRIKKELGIDEDFDSDAATQLQDLVIVESFELKPRSINKNSLSQSQNSQPTKTQWEGRKNFKTFVKNSSKSKPHNNKSFSHSFREFITFQDYDPSTDDKVSAQTEEMLNHIERQKRLDNLVKNNNEYSETTFSFRKHGRYINMNDDIQELTDIDNQHNALFVPDSDNDDDDDDDDDATNNHGGFRFTNGDGYTTKDGLGMNVRAVEVGEVPEFRKQFSKSVNEADEHSANSANSRRDESVFYNGNKANSSDDDDYDSDTPRFRFRN